MSLEIKGGAQAKKLAAEFAAASRDLLPELTKEAVVAVQPLKRDIPRSAMTTLPKSGGLAADVAASEITIKRIGNIVRVATRNAYSLKTMDAGTVRHPVRGNRQRWVTQKINPGFWTKPTTAISPKIRRELDKALQRIANKIGR